jgi:uncharacterized protein
MINENKYTVLITGASSGIGYEMAKLLAKKKFNLVLVARSEGKLNELKNEILKTEKVDINIINMDLSLPESPKNLFDRLMQKQISITHLINNAGVGDLNLFENTEWSKVNQMMDLNMKSLTELCYLFLPILKLKPHSVILNVSSIAAFFPGPNMAVYYATKAYVQSFTEALAQELVKSSVKVMALCPGPTQSGFQEAASISLSNPLFAGVPSSLEVAKYAVKLLDSSSRVGVHGFKNKLLLFSIHFLPRRLTVKMVAKLQASRERR